MKRLGSSRSLRSHASSGRSRHVHHEPEPEDQIGKQAPPDYSDVPREHLDEVVALMRRLNEQDAAEMGADELRKHLDILNRMQGFSREATLKLIDEMVNIINVKGPDKPPLEALQRSFVRMGGVKMVINVMLLRLSDPKVVAACARVLASAVQGSPLAAEAILAGGDSTQVTLLLRAIERHIQDVDVCLYGCALISHLIAPLPRNDTGTCPARARAHRNCQFLIAQLGTIDLLVDVLHTSMVEMRDAVKGCDGLKRQIDEIEEKLENGGGHSDKKNMKMKRGQKAPPSTAALSQHKVHMTALWKKAVKVESYAGRVQDAALQALLLLAVGNTEVTNLLAGALWAWPRTSLEPKYDPVEAKKAAQAKEKADAAAKAKAAAAKMKQKSKWSVKQEEDAGGNPKKDKPPCPLGLDTERRQRLGTFEDFSKIMDMPTEVLRSHPAKDRPGLSAKACRLILLMCDLQLKLVFGVNENARNRDLTNVLKIVPRMDAALMPEAPFALIAPAVEALTYTLRLHSQHVPSLSVALDALAQLREVCMRSSPAGAPPGCKEIEYAWSLVMAEAQQEEELRKAAVVLEEAFHDTTVSNQRLTSLRIGPEKLTGDGSFLTPRMLETAKKSHQTALRLASDVLSVSWNNGKASQWQKFNQIVDERNAANVQPEEVATPKSTDTYVSVPSRDEDTADPASGDAASPSSTDGKKGRKGRGKGKGKGKLDETMNPLKLVDEQEKDEFKTTQWTRAIGYGTHDEADFDRVWRRPLEEVMGRSFSDPAITRLGASSEAGDPAGLGIVRGRPADAPFDPATLEDFELRMLESEPGRLRVRVIVPSKDKVRQNVNDIRMKELLDQEVAAKAITQEITKQMRQQGYMMPKYGLQLKVTETRRADFETDARRESASVTKLPPIGST